MEELNGNNSIDNRINFEIYSINDSSIVDRIIEELFQRGYERGVASDIMEGNISMSSRLIEEKLVIMDSIYKITKAPLLNLELYCDSVEVEIIREYRILRFEKDLDTSQLHLKLI